MNRFMPRPSRRAFLGTLTTGAVFFTTRGAFAEQLALTPEREEGPFYPDRLPLDTDNDLIIVNDNITPAVGEITHLTGRVLDATGSPIRDATVEIWQCDANAVYLHTADSGPKPEQRDKNFQGFGRFTTDSTGEYRFRTIKPVPYPGRPAPHIHFKVKKGDRELLTTQLNIAGHPGNDDRRDCQRGAQRLRPGAAPGRLQADQGVEDRRAGRPLRDRPRPHPGRAVLPAIDDPVAVVGPALCVHPYHFSDRGDPMRTLTVTGMIVTGGLLIAASFAVAQRPERRPPAVRRRRPRGPDDGVRQGPGPEAHQGRGDRCAAAPPLRPGRRR